jgi:Rod binding domain-containing protein
MINGTSTDPWVSGFSSVRSLSSKPSTESVAQSFESLILRQILTSLRSTSLSDSDGPESGWLAMGDDALASYLSKAGGIGLAKSVESLLSQVKSSKV